MTEVSTDELDELLGRHAREREDAELSGRPPQWEAVARAELEPDEAIAQRRDAGDEDVERAAAYFRPFDAGETAALVDGLLAGFDDAPAETALEADPGADPEPARSGDYTTPDNLILMPAPAEASARLGSAKPSEIAVHDPGSSRSWWIPGGMLAVAAAAIAAWWIWPPSDEIRGPGGGGPVVASRDALPSYVLETDGGLKQLRGDTDTGGPAVAHHRYRRETKFEWILRPKSAARGKVAVRGFAFVDGGSAGLPLALDALTTVADSGAIRIVGEIGQLGLEPGRYTIALVVARPDALPQQAPDPAQGSSDDWELRRVEIVIED